MKREKPTRSARRPASARSKAKEGSKGAPRGGKGAGRRRIVGLGSRLNRTQLAERLRLDRKTVSKYLSLKGAPKPDKQMRYVVEEAKHWIEAQAPKLGGNSDEMRKIRESILRMEAEDMALDLQQRKGDLVKKSAIEPAIGAFLSALTENLRSKFEFELPPKYEGLDTAGRMKLNCDAMDWVLRQLKSGTAPLTR